MSEIQHVSDTALWVAHYRALESQRPDALFRDPLASELVGERGPRIARSMPYGRLLAWVMAIRTVAIDDLILEAIAEGVDTVLNIGAGLDTRPYRMEVPQNLKWVEIDFPHMIESKNESLKEHAPRCRLERHSLDFSDRDASRSLFAKIGSTANKVLVITEGVVIYLSPEETRQLAIDLHEVPNFTLWIQDYRDAVGSAWRTPRGYLKRMKASPFKFEVKDTMAFFRPLGWIPHKVRYSLDEADRLKRPFPLSFPWSLLMKLIPKSKMERFRRSAGFVLLQRCSFPSV